LLKEGWAAIIEVIECIRANPQSANAERWVVEKTSKSFLEQRNNFVCRVCFLAAEQ